VLAGLQSRADLDKKIAEQSRHMKKLHQELISLRRAFQKKENVLDMVTDELRWVH
jgi:uncharacterized coiled-coil protein SlyX